VKKSGKLKTSVILAMVVSMLLFGSTLSMAKTKIVHWQHHSPARLEMVKKFAEEFEKQYDVEIEIQSIPLGDYYTKLLPSLAAGSGPDVFQIRSTDVPTYIDKGIIAPLDTGVVSYENINEAFIPGTIKYLEADGKYYGLPTDVQTVVLFYNTEIFKEVGLTKAPDAWNELIEYAQKIHKRDDSGMTVRMGLAHGSYGPVILSFIAQTGTEFMKDGKALFDNEAAFNAFKFTTDWIVKYGVEDLDFGSRWTAFRQGELGMVAAHPAMLGSFRSTNPDLPIGIAELPAPEGQPQINVVTNWAYVMSNKAGNKELATKWIEFLTSEEAQRKWTRETGELPARKALANDQQLLEFEPLLKAPLNSLKKAIPYPFQAWTQMDTAVRKAVQKVTIEGQSPEAAFEWLVKEAEKIYAEVIEQ
jgi:ABC-type glycerol-3-phosphate transport system substrate-binding protein